MPCVISPLPGSTEVQGRGAIGFQAGMPAQSSEGLAMTCAAHSTRCSVSQLVVYERCLAMGGTTTEVGQEPMVDSLYCDDYYC
jgi:hypothetical protein